MPTYAQRLIHAVIDSRLRRIIPSQPYPLLFATICGITFETGQFVR